MSILRYSVLYCLAVFFGILSPSFFVHFSFGMLAHILLFLILIFSIFSERSGEHGSLIFAFLVGLTADGFSERFFGFWAITFLVLMFLLRIILLGYLRQSEAEGKYRIR